MSLDLTATVRSLLNEASASFFTDVEIARWLTEGARDVSGKTRCVQAVAPVILTADTLAVPIDAVWIEAITLTDTPRALIRLRPRQVGLVESEMDDDLKYFYHFGQTLYFTPQAATATTMTIFYSRWTEDTDDIPEEVKHLVAHYAAVQAMYKDRRFNEALALYTVYLTNCKFYRDELYIREAESLDALILADTTLGATA